MRIEHPAFEKQVSNHPGVPAWVREGGHLFERPSDRQLVARIAIKAYENGGVADLDLIEFAQESSLPDLFLVSRIPVLLLQGCLKADGPGAVGWRLRVPPDPPPGWGRDPPPAVA